MVRSNATDRLRLGWVAAVVLWVAAWSLLVAAACPPVGITYVYDENGRLVAVEDSTQDTAVYTYDAAGNVTAISHFATTKVLVLSFSPPCAPAPASGQGPTVTINGTGFDQSTATVTFSRSGGGTVSAPVNSATYSQLITSVPPGAGTGPVTVTVGSDSSSKTFTVGCGAPTITDFTTGSCTPPPSCPSFPCQHVGVPGTAVTITGTNFDPTPINDYVTFNNQFATVTSATPSSIATQVPSTGSSGKIRVGTPLGAMFSAADFFVPPAGKTAADMDVCNLGRITNPPSAGTSGTINVGTVSKISEVLFDGGIGGRVCLNVTSTSCSPTGCSLPLQLLSPDGTVLYPYTPTTDPFFDNHVLPLTGSYSLVLLPSPNSTGTVNFTVYEFTDIRNYAPVTMTASSSFTKVGSFSIPTTSPCQNVWIAFAGTGRRLSVLAKNPQITGGGYRVGIFNVTGTTQLTAGAPNAATDTTVPAGIYTALFDPVGIAQGSATLYMYDFVDNTGSITPGVTQRGITVDATGQNVYRTFVAGSSGSVTVARSNVTFTYTADGCGGFRGITLYDANGNPVPGGSATGDTLGPISVTPHAQYTVKLNMDVFSCSTGSFDLLVTS